MATANNKSQNKHQKKEGPASSRKTEHAASDREGALVGVPLVGIVMGSDSDLPIMVEAARILDRLEIPYELTIVSAHRTPLRMLDYARGAHGRGIKVVIAGAGGAAHLPGMIASITPLPVVGVPIGRHGLQGLDSLLSIVQMPTGVPVATVAVDNAANAGLLAARILGTSDEAILERIVAYQAELEVQVLARANRLEGDGWQLYLAGMNAGGK